MKSQIEDHKEKLDLVLIFARSPATASERTNTDVDALNSTAQTRSENVKQAPPLLSH